MEKPRLVLFDGNALIHRAYHALPPLTVSRTGEMVGAVYGFTQMLLKVSPSISCARIYRPGFFHGLIITESSMMGQAEG